MKYSRTVKVFPAQRIQNTVAAGVTINGAATVEAKRGVQTMLRYLIGKNVGATAGDSIRR